MIKTETGLGGLLRAIPVMEVHQFCNPLPFTCPAVYLKIENSELFKPVLRTRNICATDLIKQRI